MAKNNAGKPELSWNFDAAAFPAINAGSADRPNRPSGMGGHAVNDAGEETKARNREIARNESERQTVGDIRVSAWAVAVAVIIGLAALGWVLIHNN